jgi:hypothetical protein
VGKIRADDAGGAVLARGDSQFAVVRHGPVWYAVRGSPSGKHPDELRDDFGLVALKVRGRDGRWSDVLRLRPHTTGVPDSAGPLLHSPLGTGYAWGSRLRLTSGGGVVDSGDFRLAPHPFKRVVAHLPGVSHPVRALDFRPGAPVRSGVSFRFTPSACGVAMSFPTRLGDSYEYSTFINGRRASPQVRPGAILGPGSELRFDHPGAVSLERGYASALDPFMTRARIRFQQASGNPITLTLCKR